MVQKSDKYCHRTGTSVMGLRLRVVPIPKCNKRSTNVKKKCSDFFHNVNFLIKSLNIYFYL